MNFQLLHEKVLYATKKAFLEVYQLSNKEGIYAFALYSDESAMTICPATDTLSHLLEEDFCAKAYTTEDIQKLPYFEFETAEWKYEYIGAENEFDEICSMLQEGHSAIYSIKNEEEAKADFLNFQKNVYGVCVQVLKQLKEESFFKNLVGRELFLQFCVSDFDLDKNFEQQMILELNNDFFQKQFFKWKAEFD